MVIFMGYVSFREGKLYIASLSIPRSEGDGSRRQIEVNDFTDREIDSLKFFRP